jgi:acyl carrier protein
MRDRSIPAGAAAEAIADVLERSRGARPQVSADTELDRLGLESVEVVEVFVLLEERTGLVVSTPDLNELRVVRDVEKLKAIEI